MQATAHRSSVGTVSGGDAQRSLRGRDVYERAAVLSATGRLSEDSRVMSGPDVQPFNTVA